MNGGPDAPTTADYANSTAQEAHTKIAAIDARLKQIEALVGELKVFADGAKKLFKF